jgi:ribosomal protein S18 acetylase RimI-like enzyme
MTKSPHFAKASRGKQNSKIKITEPVTEEDFVEAEKIIEQNIVKSDENLDEIKSLSVGEVLVAKIDNEVVGMISMYRPGKVFKTTQAKYISLDKIKAEKSKIGYIMFLVVSKKHQGKGTGKSLVKAGVKNQKEFGAECVLTDAWQSSPNGASQKLFESLGFEAIKLHKQPWLEESNKAGPKKFTCVVCGNPCKCDELEMVKYL